MDLQRWLRRLYRVQDHCVFELACGDAAGTAWLPGETPIRFGVGRPLEPRWLEQLLAIRRHDREYVDDAHAGKAEGLIVVVDGAIVHSAYLMFGNKTACLLGWGRSAGLLGNAYTVPSYRGRGCQARSARERAAIAREAGLERVICETSPDNVASQRGLEKAGLRAAGRVRFAVVLNVLVVRTTRPSPAIRRLGLCW